MKMLNELMKKYSSPITYELPKIGFASYDDLAFEIPQTRVNTVELKNSEEEASFVGPKKVNFDVGSGSNGTNYRSYRAKYRLRKLKMLIFINGC